jgi:hypothetical protein
MAQRSGVLLAQLAEEFRRAGLALSEQRKPPIAPCVAIGAVAPDQIPSLTMPMGARLPSTTGTALIPLSISRRAILCVGVSGPTDSTSVVMISRAIIAG